MSEHVSHVRHPNKLGAIPTRPHTETSRPHTGRTHDPYGAHTAPKCFETLPLGDAFGKKKIIVLSIKHERESNSHFFIYKTLVTATVTATTAVKRYNNKKKWRELHLSTKHERESTFTMQMQLQLQIQLRIRTQMQPQLQGAIPTNRGLSQPRTWKLGAIPTGPETWGYPNQRGLDFNHEDLVSCMARALSFSYKPWARINSWKGRQYKTATTTDTDTNTDPDAAAVTATTAIKRYRYEYGHRCSNKNSKKKNDESSLLGPTPLRVSMCPSRGRR